MQARAKRASETRVRACVRRAALRSRSPPAVPARRRKQFGEFVACVAKRGDMI